MHGIDFWDTSLGYRSVQYIAYIREFEKVLLDMFSLAQKLEPSLYSSVYNASQKHESTLLHTYVLNEFLTANCSCTYNKIFFLFFKSC